MTWLAHRVVAFLLALLATAVIIAAVRVAEWADRIADRRRFERAVEDIVAGAEAEYAAHVQRRADAALLDEYAVRRPMPKRPAPPAAEPGEPWQLRRTVGADVPPGLVEPGAPNTLNGETE